MPKKPLVGPPKRLSNENQAASRRAEKALADLRSGRAAGRNPAPAKPAKPKPDSKSILGAAKQLKGAAKR